MRSVPCCVEGDARRVERAPRSVVGAATSTITAPRCVVLERRPARGGPSFVGRGTRSACTAARSAGGVPRPARRGARSVDGGAGSVGGGTGSLVGVSLIVGGAALPAERDALLVERDALQAERGATPTEPVPVASGGDPSRPRRGALCVRKGRLLIGLRPPLVNGAPRRHPRAPAPAPPHRRRRRGAPRSFPRSHAAAQGTRGAHWKGSWPMVSCVTATSIRALATTTVWIASRDDSSGTSPGYRS